VATSVYLASSEGQSGKSAVAVGILHQLSRRVGRVAVFRPVVRTADADDDHVLDLLLSRLERSGDSAAPVTPHEAAGVFYDDVHHDPDAAMSTIVDRYHAVADRFDAVLVVGSDYTDIASPTEFSFNARVAANLNSPMVLVVAGKDKTPEQVRVASDLAVGDARHHHASVLAVVANRVAREDLPALLAARPHQGRKPRPGAGDRGPRRRNPRRQRHGREPANRGGRLHAPPAAGGSVLMYTALVVCVIFVIAMGVPAVVWLTKLIRPPKPEEERIERGVKEARKRLDRHFPY